MKAVTFSEYGSPDVLRMADVPKPAPAGDQVLVKIHASSINSWDWEYLSGSFSNRMLFGLTRPRKSKQKLGADIAGTVEAVGKDVTRFKAGDAVFGDLWDNWGGFAEYACTGQDGLEPKPASLSFEHAAAVPQAGALAYQGIHLTGQVQPGQQVLVNGAGGGVGTFAVQLAKHASAEVTGVDAPHKLETILAVGADHAMDYTRQDFTTCGQRYDLILDTQVNRPMPHYQRALNPDGTLAIVGGRVPRILQAQLLDLWGTATRRTKRFRLVMGVPNKGLAELHELIESTTIAPVVDSTYPLSRICDAMRYFAEGRHCGKVAITMNVV